MSPTTVSGVLVVDKPAGLTSHDVVRRVRRLVANSKAGHLGTLDPIATGVLPVCVGKATRLAPYVSGNRKHYIGDIRLGIATATYDRDGTPSGDERAVRIDRADLERAMASLTGKLEQIPPPFSAKKVAGVASYKMARKGHTVTHRPVPIRVERFDLVRFDPPLAAFEILCSAGTYVRSLAHDLGQHLGCGAHLHSLRRLGSGEFSIEQAVGLEEATLDDVMPLDQLLTGWPRIEVSGDEERRVTHGNAIRAEVSGLARIFNKKGELLALAAMENGWVRPKVVLV